MSEGKVVDRKLCTELRDRWAMAYETVSDGKMPLVVGEECYVFFGEWVQIIEVNMFDEVHNSEVVILSRTGEQKRVEFSELQWRTNPRLADAVTRKPIGEVITEGSKC